MSYVSHEQTRDHVPRYIPAKFDHDRGRIVPGRVVTGLADQSIQLACQALF